MKKVKFKIVIAITGASGAIYAKTMLNSLIPYKDEFEIGVVFTKNAEITWNIELNAFIKKGYPFKFYENNDYFAPFASGSARYDAMVICPASMGTISRIANGISDSLILRAADVQLKERKKLILIARETPLSQIHLENMLKITMAGGIITPAIPSFYSKPKTFEELAKTVTDRALILAGIDIDTFQWGNPS